jgi:hypothetical protein
VISNFHQHGIETTVKELPVLVVIVSFDNYSRFSALIGSEPGSIYLSLSDTVGVTRARPIL